MSTRVKARRLTQDEGQYLQRLVRRGRHDNVRYRRALIIMVSASGTAAPAIARLVANPIEAQFGPLRMFTMANSDCPNHTTLARDLHAYLRWRNANNRRPEVLAAQRRERARVRSERHQRWGRRPETQAA